MVIEAVILDLDDTLIPSEEQCFVMENDILGRMGRSPMPRELHIATWGHPLYEAILARSPGVDLEAFKKIYVPTINEYTEAGRLDVIPVENLETLDRLKAMGKFVAVLTNRTHEELHHLLDAGHSLADRVSAFYYHDVMKFHKPDKRAFDEVLSDHGLSPNSSVYVGDSIGDAQAAKEAGLHFIATLESGLRTRNEFASQPVDRFISRFPAVVEAIEKLELAA